MLTLSFSSQMQLFNEDSEEFLFSSSDPLMVNFGLQSLVIQKIR
jgi:hypothetical protein